MKRMWGRSNSRRCHPPSLFRPGTGIHSYRLSSQTELKDLASRHLVCASGRESRLNGCNYTSLVDPEGCFCHLARHVIAPGFICLVFFCKLDFQPSSSLHTIAEKPSRTCNLIPVARFLVGQGCCVPKRWWTRHKLRVETVTLTLGLTKKATAERKQT